MMSSTTTAHSPKIMVAVRKRPLTLEEIAKDEVDAVQVKSELQTVYVHEPRTRVDTSKYTQIHEFRYDLAFSEFNDNETLYNKCVQPLVDSAFKEAANCSCFAYGQTGSGKTYTMLGSSSHDGIFSLAARDIFLWAEEGKENVFVSFFEIYCGRLYDLLQNRKLVAALENGKKEVVVRDLHMDQVFTETELVTKMTKGSELRRVDANSINDESSRSHAVLQVELRAHSRRLPGKLAFIDLAGSERAADSMSQSKQTQADGAGINRSLLALKECIRAMDQEKNHIPFRDSELTKVLRDVFVGKSRSLMIANISPVRSCCEQTLNTLRYAARVKSFRSERSISESKTSQNRGEGFVFSGKSKPSVSIIKEQVGSRVGCNNNNTNRSSNNRNNLINRNNRSLSQGRDYLYKSKETSSSIGESKKVLPNLPRPPRIFKPKSAPIAKAECTSSGGHYWVVDVKGVNNNNNNNNNNNSNEVGYTKKSIHDETSRSSCFDIGESNNALYEKRREKLAQRLSQNSIKKSLHNKQNNNNIQMLSTTSTLESVQQMDSPELIITRILENRPISEDNPIWPSQPISHPRLPALNLHLKKHSLHNLDLDTLESLRSILRDALTHRMDTMLKKTWDNVETESDEISSMLRQDAHMVVEHRGAPGEAFLEHVKESSEIRLQKLLFLRNLTEECERIKKVVNHIDSLHYTRKKEPLED